MPQTAFEGVFYHVMTFALLFEMSQNQNFSDLENAYAPKIHVHHKFKIIQGLSLSPDIWYYSNILLPPV